MVVDEVDCWLKLFVLEDIIVLLVLYLSVVVCVEVECLLDLVVCEVVYGGVV